MKDIKPLKPFQLWALQNFPFIEADFDVLTNYEMMCKIVEYLNNVIDNANKQNEVISDVVTLTNNLKEYIDNYFETLDVQEEVDNKLDEMAESGQLTDIIAQYLGLAGVLAFDTISDMSSAENITNGSTCYTLGQNSYNDGKGAFYKIRTVTSGDVVDGYNIVSLTVSNTLIAERISDYRLNQVENEVNLINDNLDILNNQNNGIIGLTRLGNREAWNYVYSPNGIDFYPIGENVTNTVGDASSMIEINGIFYIVGSNRYRFSKDLKNWSNAYPIINGLDANTYPRVWASTFTYDEVNNKIYCYSSYQYADEDFTISKVNVTTGHYPFKIVCNEGTINQDGSITFNQTTTDILYENDESYYDPFVIKDKVNGIILACVKSSTLQINIKKMTNYTTLEGTTYVAPVDGVEAPQLITDNQGNVYCYVDCTWTMSNTTLNGGNASAHVNGYFKVCHSGGFYDAGQMYLTPYKIFGDTHFRHLGITNASKNALKYAKEIGITVVPTHYSGNTYIENGRQFITSVNNGVIINSPSVFWDIAGSNGITPKTVFKDVPLVFKAAFSTEWKSGGNAPSYAIGKHFTGQYSRQQITVYPNGTNGTLDVPFTD